MTIHRVRAYLLALASIAVWFPAVSLPVASVGVQLTEIISIFLIAVLMTTFYSKHGRIYPSEIISILLFMVLIAQTIIQIPFVGDGMAATRYLKSCIFSFVLYLSFLQYAAKGGNSRPAWAFMVGGIIVAGLTSLDFVADILGGLTKAGFGHSRAQGFSEHANQFAIWLNCLLPMTILLPKRTVRACLFAAIVLFAVFVTGSKVNLALSLIMAYLAFGIRLGIRLPLWIIFGGILFVLLLGGLTDALVAAMNVVNPAYSAAFQAALQDPFAAESLLSREVLWNTAWSVGAERPIMGLGAGQAHLVLPLPHAHNVLFQYFLTHGVLGVFFVFGIFGCGAWTAFKWRATSPSLARAKAALILSIFAMLAANMSSDSLSGQQLSLLATMLGLISLAARERADTGRLAALQSQQADLARSNTYGSTPHPILQR